MSLTNLCKEFFLFTAGLQLQVVIAALWSHICPLLKSLSDGAQRLETPFPKFAQDCSLTQDYCYKNSRIHFASECVFPFLARKKGCFADNFPKARVTQGRNKMAAKPMLGRAGCNQTVVPSYVPNTELYTHTHTPLHWLVTVELHFPTKRFSTCKHVELQSKVLHMPSFIAFRHLTAF